MPPARLVIRQTRHRADRGQGLAPKAQSGDAQEIDRAVRLGSELGGGVALDRQEQLVTARGRSRRRRPGCGSALRRLSAPRRSVAPASSAFSTSSFTALAGRSTTSPAAMRLTVSGGRRRIGMGEWRVASFPWGLERVNPPHDLSAERRRSNRSTAHASLVTHHPRLSHSPGSLQGGLVRLAGDHDRLAAGESAHARLFRGRVHRARAEPRPCWSCEACSAALSVGLRQNITVSANALVLVGQASPAHRPPRSGSADQPWRRRPWRRGALSPWLRSADCWLTEKSQARLAFGLQLLRAGLAGRRRAKRIVGWHHERARGPRRGTRPALPCRTTVAGRSAGGGGQRDRRRGRRRGRGNGGS